MAEKKLRNPPRKDDPEGYAKLARQIMHGNETPEDLHPGVRSPETETVVTEGSVRQFASYLVDILPPDKRDKIEDMVTKMRKDGCPLFFQLRELAGAFSSWLQYGN